MKNENAVKDDDDDDDDDARFDSDFILFDKFNQPTNSETAMLSMMMALTPGRYWDK